MKKFMSLVMAGALGAVITLAVFNFMQKDGVRQTSLEVTPVSTTNTSYTNAVATGPNFTLAAEKALEAVVQIQAQESESLAQQRREKDRRSDPMSQLLEQFGMGGEDLFGFGFGYPNRPKEGSGSGVIISEDGYIVTNNHVVEFADVVLIKTRAGKEYEATIIGRDPSTDLAVLQIDAKNLPTLEFANSDQAKIGEWVLAVGNPYKYLTSTVTAGIISAKGRDLDLIRGEKTIESFIQTDAAINPGNSGGALVDVQGRLIGINTAIASQTGNYSGYSFAIPVNLMSQIVEAIIENGADIERTSLGVAVVEIDEDFAKELGISFTKGVYVDEVLDGSPAQYAGILPTDIILAINEKEVGTFDDLKKYIDFAKVGDTLDVKVWRNGEHRVIPVRLSKRF